MSTRLHDPITVAAVFQGGRVRPVWFLRQGRRYAVREVTLAWQTKMGSAVCLHLSVSDGANEFELVLNQQQLTWHVEAAEAR